MQSGSVSFLATVSIINQSPTSKSMLGNLPDVYNKTENTGNYTLMYGSGYAMDKLKQTVLQGEANNALNSPEIQTNYFKVDGPGIYLIEFDVPFVTPPLNVSISNTSLSDVFI